MEIKLHSPRLEHYTNEDHNECNIKLYIIFDKYKVIIVKMSLILDYKANIDEEDLVYRWVRRSEYTAKKAETDHERDKIYKSLVAIVRQNLENFDPSLQDNAKHVYNMLQSYGDVIRKDYDGETYAINNIIIQLRSPEYTEAAKALGLTPWINKLEEVNTLFESYVKDVEEEHINKPEITLREARRKTDISLRNLMDRVTGLILLNLDKDVSELVKEFNVVVDHYNTILKEHYGRIHAKTDLSSADVSDIPTQIFTGKPIFVIPTVTLTVTKPDGTVNTIELVFTKDFTVAYKNNINPGMATLTVQGIGKYCGEVVTTFQIQ